MFPERVALWNLQFDQDRVRLKNLYKKHVPDNNVLVLSTREKNIDKLFNSELRAFLCRYSHIVVVLSRKAENVSLVRKCVFGGGFHLILSLVPLKI